MNSIGQFLTQHIQNIHSVSPQSTVRQALELMAEKNIGALLVLDEKQLVSSVLTCSMTSNKSLMVAKPTI